MMGKTPGLLVCALFHFTFMNWLVVLSNLLVLSVLWGLAFLFLQESSDLVTFLRWSFS